MAAGGGRGAVAPETTALLEQSRGGGDETVEEAGGVRIEGRKKIMNRDPSHWSCLH